MCLECPGTLGWAPIELGGVAECGVFILLVLVVVGFFMACYTIYSLLFLQTQHMLERSQHLVENVHKTKQAAGSSSGGGGVKAAAVAAAAPGDEIV